MLFILKWFNSLDIKDQIAIIVTLVNIVSISVNIWVNWIMKKRDIKANIVSKSRIEWISEVRILIADFIRQINKVNMSITHYKIYKEDQKKGLKITNEISEYLLELLYKLNVITLLFKRFERL